MKQDVQIDLRNITYAISGGYETETSTDSTVWAGRRSATRNEFYQASQAGYKADVIFTIYSFEYGGEEQVVFNNVVYDIVRTYQKTPDILELTCQMREEK